MGQSSRNRKLVFTDEWTGKMNECFLGAAAFIIIANLSLMQTSKKIIVLRKYVEIEDFIKSTSL
jgi:hypothetical protein